MIEIRITSILPSYKGRDRNSIKVGDLEHFPHFGNVALEKI